MRLFYVRFLIKKRAQVHSNISVYLKATIVKVPSGSWKAVIRRTGYPTVSKSFRIKRDAESWARRTEDEIIRGIYVSQSHSEKTSINKAL